MAKASISEQQKALKKATRRLNEVKEAMASDESREAYLEFMARFAQIETAYKSLLSDYLRAERKPVDSKDLTIDWKEVPRVLAYFSIELSDSDKTLIFNGRQKIGERNARGLRNSLAHTPNKKAINELQVKFNQLMASMQAFEHAISPLSNKPERS